MISAAPKILAFETESAWAVVLAVSLVTLPLALLLRRLIARPGGFASGVLVALPLVMPLVAALAYGRGAFPEVAVLKPIGPALIEQSRDLGSFLLVWDRDSGVYLPYAVLGSPGRWLVILAVVASSFMLARRLLGCIVTRRLIARCEPIDRLCDNWNLRELVARLASDAGLKRPPEVLVLPEGASGAFACGGRRMRILLARDLIATLDEEELEAVVAHEMSHLAARDVQVIFCAGMLRDLVAWNPFAHLAFRKLVTDREMEADRRAATLTGRPLALASGLLKACHGKRPRSRAVPALRGRGSLARRVDGLLALADGKTRLASPGALPYLLAAVMVAVVGLQAGARTVEGGSPGAITLVWGAPEVAGADLWAPRKFQPPQEGKGSEEAQQGRRQQQQRRGAGRIYYEDPEVYIHEVSSMALKRRHLRRYFRSMNRVAAEIPAIDRAIRVELERAWKATPLSSRVGPIGLYRLETGMMAQRAQ